MVAALFQCFKASYHTRDFISAFGAVYLFAHSSLSGPTNVMCFFTLRRNESENFPPFICPYYVEENREMVSRKMFVRSIKMTELHFSESIPRLRGQNFDANFAIQFRVKGDIARRSYAKIQAQYIFSKERETASRTIYFTHKSGTSLVLRLASYALQRVYDVICCAINTT